MNTDGGFDRAVADLDEVTYETDADTRVIVVALKDAVTGRKSADVDFDARREED